MTRRSFPVLLASSLLSIGCKNLFSADRPFDGDGSSVAGIERLFPTGELSSQVHACGLAGLGEQAPARGSRAARVQWVTEAFHLASAGATGTALASELAVLPNDLLQTLSDVHLSVRFLGTGALEQACAAALPGQDCWMPTDTDEAELRLPVDTSRWGDDPLRYALAVYVSAWDRASALNRDPAILASAAGAIGGAFPGLSGELVAGLLRDVLLQTTRQREGLVYYFLDDLQSRAFPPSGRAVDRSFDPAAYNALVDEYKSVYGIVVPPGKTEKDVFPENRDLTTTVLVETASDFFCSSARNAEFRSELPQTFAWFSALAREHFRVTGSYFEAERAAAANGDGPDAASGYGPLDSPATPVP